MLNLDSQLGDIWHGASAARLSMRRQGHRGQRGQRVPDGPPPSRLAGSPSGPYRADVDEGADIPLLAGQSQQVVRPYTVRVRAQVLFAAHRLNDDHVDAIALC